jgi:hypothetical protein
MGWFSKASMSKKAVVTFSLALVVIVAAITLVLLVMLFVKIAENAEEQAHASRCKASVIAHAKVRGIPFGEATSDESDIECPTRFVTIEEGSKLEMKRQVADLMYECWNNYGEGKVKLFSAKDVKFCAVCSVFKFEDRSVELDDFNNFLIMERIPKKTADGLRPTYYDYIAGVDTGTIIPDSVGAKRESYLDGQKRYAVMFTFYKESWWEKTKNAIIVGTIFAVATAGAAALTVLTFGAGGPVFVIVVTAGGAALGGAIGAAGTTAADWSANLVMTEYSGDNLVTLGCDALPVSMVPKEFQG